MEVDEWSKTEEVPVLQIWGFRGYGGLGFGGIGFRGIGFRVLWV